MINPALSGRVLLAVLAHPDDESFGMGGTLALYANRGVDVHLVCATRGEVGSVVPELMEGFEQVADLRVHELRCAADVLGLAGVHFLDYRDSGMPGSPDNDHPRALAAAPVEEVAAKVAHYIRLLKPQVVLTNDPIGGYGHPDHIAIHKAATMAFHLAGERSFVDDLPPYQPVRLYYNVFPKGLLRLAVRILPLFGQDPRRFGRNKDIDLLALVEQGEFPIHAAVDFRSVQRESEEAAACHASQLDSGPPRRSPLNWLLRWFNRRDYFMQAYPSPTTRKRKGDLFEGFPEG
jgi:LmbE family N-acetylglucosaminyl deacetylase